MEPEQRELTVYEKNRILHDKELLEKEKSINYVNGDLNIYFMPLNRQSDITDQTEVIISDQYNQI